MKTLTALLALCCFAFSATAYADETFTITNQLKSPLTLQTDATSPTTVSFNTLQIASNTVGENIGHYELDAQGQASIKFSIAITPTDIIYVDKTFTRSGNSLLCSTSSNYHKDNASRIIFTPTIVNELCKANPKITIRY